MPSSSLTVRSRRPAGELEARARRAAHGGVKQLEQVIAVEWSARTPSGRRSRLFDREQIAVVRRGEPGRLPSRALSCVGHLERIGDAPTMSALYAYRLCGGQCAEQTCAGIGVLEIALRAELRLSRNSAMSLGV